MGFTPNEEQSPQGQPQDDTAFFGHPRGLRTLFFAEMWERFSFYGMKAILVPFMTLAVAGGGLGFEVDQAGMLLAIYGSLAYFMNLPGGWAADYFLGQRRAVFAGGVLIMAGHVCLALHGLPFFYSGLAFIIFGTGLLKPNMTSMVGQLYRPGDVRRDAGFTIYYLGINIGAFLAPLVCGTLAQYPWFADQLQAHGIDPRECWHFGFGAAAVGMFFGLILYVWGGRRLGTIGLQPTATPSGKVRIAIGIVLVLAGGAVATLWAGLWAVDLAWLNTAVFVVLVATPVVVFAAWFLFGGLTPDEKKRLLVVAALFTFSALFFGAMEQGSGTLNLFANDHTQNEVFGLQFAPSWFQSVNPILVLVLSPVFAWLWTTLGTRQPSSPAKFVIALFVIGATFLVMTQAARLAVSGDILVGPGWLVVVFFGITVGELCLSPVGLSLVSRLAPARAAGQLMGVWFITNALGNYLAGQALALSKRFALPDIFLFTAVGCLIAGLVLACVARPIGRLVGDAR